MRLSHAAAVASFLILGACSPPVYLPYHSTADIPHYHTSTATEVSLVTGDEKRVKSRPYAVLNAIDDGDLHYVLFAPKNPRYRGANRVRAVNIGRGVPMTESHARAFASGLSDLLAVIGTERGTDRGTLYEFYYAPQQDITRVSQDVVEWQPTLKFAYTNTDRGAAGRLILGEGGVTTYSFELDDADDVRDLLSLLQEAIGNLPSTD